MKVKLPLTLNEHSIGHILFNIIDEENIAGNATLVGMDEQAAIKRYLEDQLSHNPDDIAIAGGHIVRNIGNYGDGILQVLRAGADKFGYIVDESEMPILKVENERPF